MQANRRDYRNFDPQYTRESATLTPVSMSALTDAGVDQEDFAGFTYVNDAFIQHLPANRK